MKPHWLTMILVFLASSTFAQDDATKEELKKLQGSWVRTLFSADGKTEDDGDRPADKAVYLDIKGNDFHGQKFTIDITKSPRHLDIIDVGPKGKQFTLPGIYELKGDVLKICLPFPFEGKTEGLHKRPTEFATKAGENHVVEVYRRVKK
ncbi:MAG: TIGR03067 domain-containing protein [Gemmatales bacterium]